MKSGIYKITNNLNHHFYIGQSIHVQKRWKEHRRTFNENKMTTTVLQKAFHKYGFENFSFEIIEECEPDKLNEREIFYIATLKPEYNMNEGGTGNKGYVVTDEIKRVLSNYGRKQWDSYDTETRNRIIKNQLTGPRKGKHRSEETKKLLSEKTKAYFRRVGGMSEEQKQKISATHKGKKRPNDERNFKPVMGVSKNGITVYFPSGKYAAFILDINSSALYHCVAGHRPTAGGFTWKYCSQETIQSWSRAELITARSAMHPEKKDEDIVQAITKNGSYGVTDKGLIALARRSNTIKTIAAEAIHENDIIDVELGMNRHLSHKIDITKERGEIIAYYCLVELVNGGVQFAIMSKKDIEKHRNKFSKAYDPKDPNNIWNKNFDAMALKTCVIQALKLCPISIEAMDAVSREERADIKDVSEEVEYTVTDVEAKPSEEAPAIESKPAASQQAAPQEEIALTPEEEAAANAAFDSIQEPPESVF